MRQLVATSDQVAATSWASETQVRLATEVYMSYTEVSK